MPSAPGRPVGALRHAGACADGLRTCRRVLVRSVRRGADARPDRPRSGGSARSSLGQRPPPPAPRRLSRAGIATRRRQNATSSSGRSDPRANRRRARSSRGEGASGPDHKKERASGTFSDLDGPQPGPPPRGPTGYARRRRGSHLAREPRPRREPVEALNPLGTAVSPHRPTSPRSDERAACPTCPRGTAVSERSHRRHPRATTLPIRTRIIGCKGSAPLLCGGPVSYRPPTPSRGTALR